MRGKKQGSDPLRQHRPTGSPFATRSSELDRRHMYRDDKAPEEGDDQEIQAKKLADPDVEVRREAIKRLWEVMDGGRRMQMDGRAATRITYEALVRATFDDDWKVRWDAALAIGKLAHSSRWETDPYIAKIAHWLKDKEMPSEAKICAIQALERIGAPCYPYAKAIADHLEHADWKVRLTAVTAMGNLGPEQHHYRAIIVRLKRDDHEEVRKAADETLRKVPWEEPVWMQVQTPRWQKRVAKAVQNGSRR